MFWGPGAVASIGLVYDGCLITGLPIKQPYTNKKGCEMERSSADRDNLISLFALSSAAISIVALILLHFLSPGFDHRGEW